MTTFSAAALLLVYTNQAAAAIGKPHKATPQKVVSLPVFQLLKQALKTNVRRVSFF
ncbi:hypothetical protein SUBVAR_04099 [Subdoligranulum variabile DSM 15176]|uniref:Uncharacterized protein n=1 Tax=Subdoligranulum variabile DSM 15176 TaxID=411471 RepID=D1PID4_9FIRM|nr:hypothetical protein SUBVAR_04099 [Subdoligranulum variabile DSM 15176]